ncbi:MAG: hypothetical protein JWO05_3371 [Gemmatimonadetes bacterium]|nr:hypothetical protein [Gemmatimonadota bacterium]
MLRPALLLALALLPSPDRRSSAYDEAVLRASLRQAADDSVASPGGRSILMTHGARAPRVLVMLHGFTDAPTQFFGLGMRFYEGGDNIYIPRLPHHAVRTGGVRALSRVRAEEMAAFGDSVVAEAAGLGDTIIVIGLSAGGAITGSIALTHPEVSRVVLIAPALAAGVISNDAGRTISLLASRLPAVTRTEGADSTGPDYAKGMNSRGLAQVLRLGQMVRDGADKSPPAVKRIAFLLNDRDRTVSDDVAMELARKWSSQGATVSAAFFGKSSRLPHNVMEEASHGGNPDIVYPVIEAIVLNGELPPQVRSESMQSSCGFWRCKLVKIAKVGLLAAL